MTTSPSSDGWIEREAERLAMQAGSTFDLKGEPLNEREAEVAARIVTFAREVERRAVERAAAWHDLQALKFDTAARTDQAAGRDPARRQGHAAAHRESAAAIRALVKS